MYSLRHKLCNVIYIFVDILIEYEGLLIMFVLIIKKVGAAVTDLFLFFQLCGQL